MKLEVEIKDDTFIYSYEIGSSRHSSTSPLSADTFVILSDLIKHCNSITHIDRDDRWNEIKAKAWIEKNKEEAKKFLETEMEKR